jgi:peptidoglycan hydrolase-like protein with peptidoglycan-binding domain
VSAPETVERAPARVHGRGRRALTLLLAAALVAGGAWAWRHQRAGRPAESAAAPATATATVVRRDLQGTQEVQGTLGYSDGDQAVNRRQGTLTWLPQEGAVVRRGRTLYRVDDLPVPLLYGSLPFWRELRAGVDDGRDVTQLERNLAALGYDPGTVDDHFSGLTRQALKDWQQDLGLGRTGAFQPGDAVVMPGAARVGQVSARRGAPASPGQPVMALTSTTRQVSVDLDTTQLPYVKVGDPVEITLPDGRTTPGRVAEVSKVAEASSDNSGGGGGGGAGGAGGAGGGGSGGDQTTVPVTISLDRPRDTGDLDQAPVDVSIVTESRKGVLAVPVNALLALAEGGYAVEVAAAGGSRHLAGVRLGLFADGLVEVSGRGLSQGTKVVVPR